VLNKSFHGLKNYSGELMAIVEFNDNTNDNEARIKVIGVGGAGGNALNRMVESSLRNVDLIAVNTDSQALRRHKNPIIKVQIGEQTTKGLGVGGDPEKGKKSALESEESIKEIVKDADLIFITAGMGGGTGTGAAPVIAKIAREITDSLIIGVVTRPFGWEGAPKANLAEKGIEEMRAYVDSMLIIPNSRLSETLPKEISVDDAFKAADDVLKQAIKGITDVITSRGIVNVDFADIKSIMKNSNNALIGIGKAKGENRHIAAAKQAITSPLLENTDIHDAKGIIVNFTSSKSLKLVEIEEAVNYIKQMVSNEDVKLKFGKVYDDNLNDEMQVTVIATGFPSKAVNRGIEENDYTLSKDKIYYGNNEFVKSNLNEFDSQADNFDKPAYLRVKRKILD